MVHALEESLRVLKPKGWLLDMRPIHGDARMHVIIDGSFNLAGPIDHSGWIIDDEAADKALQSVQDEGGLSEEQRSHFQLADYWDSLDKFNAYVDEKWDVSSHVPNDCMSLGNWFPQGECDPITSVTPDFNGLIWWVTLHGRVGTLNPKNAAIKSMQFESEEIQNSFAVAEDGISLVVPS